MADWQTANTGSFVPSELSSVIDLAGTTAATASTVIGTIQSAVDLLSTIVVGLTPFDFLGALAETVEEFKIDFLGTGIYMLNMWDYPMYQMRVRVDPITGSSFETSFESDVIDALNDSTDPNRPVIATDAAALLLVSSSGTTSDLVGILRSVKEAFIWWDELASVVDAFAKLSVDSNLQDVESAIRNGDIRYDDNPTRQSLKLLRFKDIRLKMRELSNSSFEDVVEPIVPTPESSIADIENWISTVENELENPSYPNFQQVSLTTIVPPLKDAVNNALDPLIAALAAGASIGDTIEAFVEALQSKIDALDNIVTSINNILAQLDNLLALTSLDSLYVETSNGTTGLATEIAAAGNKPFEGSEGYYSGILLVAGGTGLTAFRNLFGPIGGA